MEDGKEEVDFPIPFLLLIAGYTFILIIDKVLFDSHAIFDAADEHGHGHLGVEEARDTLRKSIANFDDSISANKNLRES